MASILTATDVDSNLQGNSYGTAIRRHYHGEKNLDVFPVSNIESVIALVRDLVLEDGQIKTSEDAFFVVNKPGLTMSLYVDYNEDDGEFDDDNSSTT